jgi:hypothetical protein
LESCVGCVLPRALALLLPLLLLPLLLLPLLLLPLLLAAAAAQRPPGRLRSSLSLSRAVGPGRPLGVLQLPGSS